MVIADRQHIREVVSNPRHDQRVRVGHVDQCEPTHPGPCQSVAGNSGGSARTEAQASRRRGVASLAAALSSSDPGVF